MWTIERSPNSVCAKAHVRYSPNQDWEQWVLVTSDEHIDSPKCEVALLRHHMDQAVDRNAMMVKLGDSVDAMQGKSDRRSSKDDLADQYKRKDYLNALVEGVVEFYRPYKDHIGYLGYGNHETSLIKYYEFDVLALVARDLQLQGSPVVLGGYRGWIKFLFSRESGGRFSINLYQVHGYGGGGPVTKDVIQANRKAVYLPDADIVVSGHTHDRNIFPIEQIRLSASGKEFQTTQYHVKTGGYKNEFLEQDQGFVVEKGMPPKTVGGYWIRFYYSSRTKRVEFQIFETDR